MGHAISEECSSMGLDCAEKVGPNTRRGRMGVPDEDDDSTPGGFTTPTSVAQRTASRFIVRCTEGHTMKAKLNPEVHIKHYYREYCSPVVAECAMEDCENPEILHTDARYFCPICDEYKCLQCSRKALALPMLNTGDDPDAIINLEPGDIILAGPTAFGIHHVILVISPLAKDPWLHEHLSDQIDSLPGEELWFCETIESTQGSVGDDTWWYRTKTYFLRDPHHGKARLVADWPEPQDEKPVIVAEESVPFKILLHPVRKDIGGPGLNTYLFKQCVEQAAQASKRYSQKTAVASFLNAARRRRFGFRDPTLEQYPTPQARAKLLEKYKEAWEAPPLCASVAVKAWQRYFVAQHSRDEDFACQQIMLYMPCLPWIVPSQMTKKLVEAGWFIVDNLEERVFYDDDD